MGRGERIWRHASRVGWLGEQLGTLKDLRRFPFAFCYAGKKVGRVFVEGRRRGSSSEGEVYRPGVLGRGARVGGLRVCVGGCVEAEGQACGVRLAHSGLLQRAL
jgi:hypothetical protein